MRRLSSLQRRSPCRPGAAVGILHRDCSCRHRSGRAEPSHHAGGPRVSSQLQQGFSIGILHRDWQLQAATHDQLRSPAALQPAQQRAGQPTAAVGISAGVAAVRPPAQQRVFAYSCGRDLSRGWGCEGTCPAARVQPPADHHRDGQPQQDPGAHHLPRDTPGPALTAAVGISIGIAAVGHRSTSETAAAAAGHAPESTEGQREQAGIEGADGDRGSRGRRWGAEGADGDRGQLPGRRLRRRSLKESRVVSVRCF